MVRTGYRIALKLSGDEGIAWRTGLLLALFYFMPFLAVRNLVEVACIPFLMLGAWRLVRDGDKPALGAVLVAGIWFPTRDQRALPDLFMSAGAGLGCSCCVMCAGPWCSEPGCCCPWWCSKAASTCSSGTGLRRAHRVRDVQHGTLHHAVRVLPWYNFLLLLAGVFIPPLSLGVLFGFFRRWKPLPVWLALFAFLAFHSWHPNKQERFIFPLLPLYFVLGYRVGTVAAGLGLVAGAAGPATRAAHLDLGLNLLLLVVLTFLLQQAQPRGGHDPAPRPHRCAGAGGGGHRRGRGPDDAPSTWATGT